MTKKYKLHCFGCGSQFFNKEEVKRHNNEPYCFECFADIVSNRAALDYEIYLEEKWNREHPGVDREQYEIDQANIRKYGEY